jgi:hypothetical protein
MAPSSKKRNFLIKYFAVPKGVIDKVVQDLRIIFHAGANRLNDSVCAPIFSLSMVNALLRTMDFQLLMEDRDIGESFLNFNLHPQAQKFAAVDLGLLCYMPDECRHC